MPFGNKTATAFEIVLIRRETKCRIIYYLLYEFKVLYENHM